MIKTRFKPTVLISSLLFGQSVVNQGTPFLPPYLFPHPVEIFNFIFHQFNDNRFCQDIISPSLFLIQTHRGASFPHQTHKYMYTHSLFYAKTLFLYPRIDLSFCCAAREKTKEKSRGHLYNTARRKRFCLNACLYNNTKVNSVRQKK